MKLQHPENRSRFLMNGSIDEEDGSDDPVLLDPAVWGGLSSDILAMILGWLPLPALCRFRSVSKAWHAAIGRIRKVRHGPWYVSCAEGAVKIANPRDWELFGRHWRSLPQMPGLGICRLCAAAGGLFYFVVAGGDFPYKDDAVVLNPLTGYWKELPRVPRIVELRMERMSVWRGMEALGQDGDFLVVNLVECVPRYVRRRDIVQVYDSRQRRWSTNAELVLEPGECCAPGSAALHGSILYFLTIPGNPDATARLRSFRLDSDLCGKCESTIVATWKDLPKRSFLSPGQADRNPKLFFWGERCMLASFGEVRPGSANETIFLHALDAESKTWIEFDRLRTPGKKRAFQDLRVAADPLEQRLTLSTAENGYAYDLSTKEWSRPWSFSHFSPCSVPFFPYTPSFCLSRSDV